MAKIKKENLIEGFKIILRQSKPYKRVILFLTFLSVLAALVNASVPYFSGRVIDSILSSKTFSLNIIYLKSIPVVFLFVAIWFFLRLLNDLTTWRIELRNVKLGSQLESNYLVEGFGRLLEFPLSFHKSRKMGEVTNRITRAADLLSDIVREVLVRLAPDFLSIIFAVVFTFFIQPILASIILGGVFIYVAVLFFTAPRFANLSRKMHKSFNMAYGDSYDVLLNVSSVKQAGAEQYERKKFYRNFFLRAFRFWNELRKIFGIMDIWQKALIAFVQLSIFVISIFLIRGGSLTIGQLVMFNGYAAMFFGPFVVLGRNWQLIQNGLAAIERSENILSLPTEPYVPKNPVVLRDFKGEVVFENISFSYGKKRREVLKNISFKVRPGEKIALVGESGVGKSTLVDLISYYYQPASGKVLIDGHSVKNFDLRYLRSNIAVVPQEIILFNDTIKNNIRYGSFRAGEKEVERAAKLAHASDFIESFPKKYNQIVGERGIKLSVGQKQRIALARAFLRNPKILILDEPTSALDARSEGYIQESLKELMRGRTTFIIAHRLSTVREADKIFVLEKGMIAESGTHDELMGKGGIYKKLYDLQFRPHHRR